MLSMFCYAICNLSPLMDAKMAKDAPSSTTSCNNNQQESRRLSPKILYIKGENLFQKPPYVSLARSALHSISKPIPDNRNPGSMIGLDPSNMFLPVQGYESPPWNM